MFAKKLCCFSPMKMLMQEVIFNRQLFIDVAMTLCRSDCVHAVCMARSGTYIFVCFNCYFCCTLGNCTQDGKGSNVTGLAMRNSTDETATVNVGATTTLRATHRMVCVQLQCTFLSSHITISIEMTILYLYVKKKERERHLPGY